MDGNFACVRFQKAVFMRRLVVCAVFLVLTLSVTTVTFAQVRPWENAWDYACPQRSSGATDSVFPRYEYRNRRLVLVDILTGQVTKEVETSLSSPQVLYLGWSPDCRYLAESVAAPSGNKTVVWDVTTSTRILELPQWRLYVDVSWNPNSRHMVADTSAGAYVFDTATSKLSLLSPPVDRSVYWNRHPFDFVRWDNLRNQVIAVQVNGDVVAYDIATGSVSGYFHEKYPYGNPDFVLSPDNTKIVTFSVNNAGFLSIWDRDTLTRTRIFLPRTPYVVRPKQVAISPDNRYVVVDAGYLFIWDLTDLPADEFARTPKRSLDWIDPIDLQFVNSEVIAYATAAGETIHWDVNTMQPVPAS